MLPHDHYLIGFDLETGGFDPYKNPIVSATAIVLDNKGEEVERLELFIKNEFNLEITPSSVKIHGIQPNDIRILNGITVKELYESLKSLFQKYTKGKGFKPIIVGHNVAKFDINNYAQKYIFERFKDSIYNYIEDFIFDTQYISRLKYRGVEVVGSFTLNDCCEREGIEITDAHNATNDVLYNLQLANKLINSMTNVSGIVEENEESNGIRGKYWI